MEHLAQLTWPETRVLTRVVSPLGKAVGLTVGTRQARVSGLTVDAMGHALRLETLLQFMREMSKRGLPLQGERLLYDRIYAFERLSVAHSSAWPKLRDLAIQLFSQYQ